MTKEIEDYIRRKLTGLAKDFGLSFTHNPGGGEFYKEDWGRCQISTYDDYDDLVNVLEWIIGNLIKRL